MIIILYEGGKMKKIFLIVLFIFCFTIKEAKASKDNIEILENNNIQHLNDNYISGKINIELYDEVTKGKENTGSTKFEGNIFSLYDSNGKLLETYESNSDGKISITNLNEDKYKLRHEYISEGYIKEKEVYDISVSKNNLVHNINIFLKPQKTLLKIYKTYGNPVVGTRYYDNDVTFEIIDSKNKKIKDIKTNKHGECSTVLYYDTYIVRQVNTNKIKKSSEDYVLNKNEFYKNNEIFIYTPTYIAKVKVKLFETSSLFPIKNMDFNLNGKKYVTNNDGYFITEKLNEGSYALEQFPDDEYCKFGNVKFVIDNNSKFYIENNEVYIDVIIYNVKKISEENNINNEKLEIVNGVNNKDNELINKIYKEDDLYFAIDNESYELFRLVVFLFLRRKIVIQ